MVIGGKTMSQPDEKVDELIARITTSLEQLSGTELGGELFTDINERLREIVESGAVEPKEGPSKRRRDDPADREDERLAHRGVIDLSVSLATKLPCTWPSS